MERQLRLFVAVELGVELRPQVHDAAKLARLCGFRRVPIELLPRTQSRALSRRQICDAPRCVLKPPFLRP